MSVARHHSAADNAPDPYSLLAQAIQEKKQVIAFYHGYYRELCPHVIGINRASKRIGLFYEFGGESERPLGPPGSPKNWRCMFIDELVDVSLRDGPWHTAPDHSRPETCVFHRIALSVD